MLNQKEQQLEDGCSILENNKNLNLQSSVIVESAAENNKTILSDKSVSCKNNSRKQKSLKILDRGLITSDRDLTPYWTDCCKEKSSQLWLPTKTVLEDLEPISSNILSTRMVENSWFSTELYTVQKKNLPRICYQYLPSFLVECTDLGDTQVRSKKIRIYPNKDQKLLFNRWFGTSRFVYNQTVTYLKQPDTKASWLGIKTGILHDLPDWSKEIPYQIKSIAIQDACKAVSKAKLDFKKTKKVNEVKYRSRKETRQSCYIPKSAITDLGIYHSLTGRLKWTEELPEEFYDSRLIRENGRYFVCIPYSKADSNIIEKQDNRVVAIDPGVRAFATFYSEDSCGKIGFGDNKRIFRLCLVIDKLISALSKTKDLFKKFRIKSLIGRLKWKIHDLISELHYKTALFFVKNFDIILLPTFEVSEMTNKTRRKIKSKTVRNMLSLCHYKFKQIIKAKAFEFGKVVVDVCEAYTSQTVSWTGELVKNLNSSKIIKSKSTGIKMDRDINGARGIMLRAMGDTPILNYN